MYCIVDAVMLTGGTPKAEVRDISMRLAAMASSKDRSGATHEIKLCYVTVSNFFLFFFRRRLADRKIAIQPEKIARNKMFLSMLEKLASAGKLGESDVMQSVRSYDRSFSLTPLSPCGY